MQPKPPNDSGLWLALASPTCIAQSNFWQVASTDIATGCKQMELSSCAAVANSRHAALTSDISGCN